MSKQNMEIDSYLLFGYSLDYKNNGYSLDLSLLDKEKYLNLNEHELIEIGADKFKKYFADEFDSSKQNVVPLSGGIDSRAILAALSEFCEMSSICTYTFGSPGAYDYDIGNDIARQCGTKHKNINLDKHRYDLSELIDASKRFDFQSPLFIHPPILEIEEQYKNSIIWSGVNAGAVVGSFVLNQPSDSLNRAKQRFLEKGSFVKSINLCFNEQSKLVELMNFNSIDSNIVTYDEQVFIRERSEKHLANNVLIKGFEYKTPFINNDFMNFMFSQKSSHRFNKKLYKKIINRAFPNFFKTGIEGHYNLGINANDTVIKIKRKWLKATGQLKYWSNYIDFTSAIREREDIKKIIFDSILDLKARNIVDWIDIENIWSKHQMRKADFSDALIALASLEIHLKAGKPI